MARESDFRNNFYKILSGTVIGQVLPVAITPILTRLYTPEEIGHFSVYFGVVSIISSVVCLKMDQVIVLVKNHYESNRIVRISQKISVYISIVCLITLVFGKVLANYDLVKDFPYWWFLLSIHFYFYGIFQAYTFLYNRRKNFGIISKSKIINGTVYPIMQIVFYKINSLGLVLGLLIGTIVSSLYLLFENKFELRPGIQKMKINRVEAALLYKHRNFPVYAASNSLVNSFSNNLPLLLLGSFYSSTVTGFYSYGHRIIQAPMGFIMYSVSQVFYQEVAQRVANHQNIFSLVKKTYIKLFMLGIVPYFMMLIFAPTIFSFVFGSAWEQAGVYTQYMIPWFFLVFLNSPITSIIMALDKQKEYFYFEIIVLIMRTSALLAGYILWNDPIYSILLYSIVGVVYNSLLSIYLFKIAKNS